MIYIVPTAPTDGNNRQRTVLDGVEYEILFRYNARESNWYFSLLDTNGNFIATWRKLVVNYPLLQGDVGQDIPPGFLYNLDRTISGDEATLKDLGDRVVLMYIDNDSSV